jgi:hypothetical protein
MNGSFARFYWLPFAQELLKLYEEEKAKHE